MGFVPWATSSIAVMFVLLFLCGWFQGMGWPPCGRTMVHWWSQKERGGIVSVWNCAHNVGGGIPPLLFLLGMAWFNDWKAALLYASLWRDCGGAVRFRNDARYAAILRSAAYRRV
ncbi:sn-glycerol-3-phosphate transporter [Salmonella enterica subsp. enterica]|uniref:sn-glycerol-3-phosphate transporter n=1 Tax=Salmonella enterica I TaxID=59201 RepID=A0A447TZF9_SALET|nr:sn-glycerol-3-phosphate transporter [Salmonella enterica subsp. enterica]